MKISKKKLRLYKAVEFCGQVLFWTGIAVLLFCTMIGADIGVFVSAGWTFASIAIWGSGASLKAGLYVCPNCGQKLLIKKIYRRKVIMKELPAFCESCGWRVQFEEE